MWLEVARSDNLPEYPAMYYVEAVKDLGGCPVEVVTHLGTENSLQYWHLSRATFDKTLMPIAMSLQHVINGLRVGGHSVAKTDHHGGEIFSRFGSRRQN